MRNAGKHHVTRDKHIGVDYTWSSFSHLVYSLLQIANEATSRPAVFLHTICCDGVNVGVAAQWQAGMTLTFW